MAHQAFFAARRPSQLPALEPVPVESSSKLTAAFSDALAQLELPERATLAPINKQDRIPSGSACRETLAKRVDSNWSKHGNKAASTHEKKRSAAKRSAVAKSGKLASVQATGTDATMQDALARVGVHDVEDLLANGVSGAAGPIFISKCSRQRKKQETSKAGAGPKKLRQLKKLYAKEENKSAKQQRVQHTRKPAIHMASVREGRNALEELLECLAQRQMQTVQLQRMMLGELKFKRDPHRLSLLVQEIGTLEAQLCETEEKLLQTLKTCEWFVMKDQATYGQALAHCAQEVVAELTDEATEAYNENSMKAHEDEWRLRIGVFLHSVPKIETGSFETLVQHVASSRKEFTDALAIFVESGKLNSEQRGVFEKVTKQMQSEAQIAMEMSWRLRDSQRQHRAAQRANTLPRQAPDTGYLALDLQKQLNFSISGAEHSPEPETGQLEANRSQRRSQVRGAELAIQGGIEDVRSGIRDMIARVRTRRQPTTLVSNSKSVPVSPAVLREITFTDDAQLGGRRDIPLGSRVHPANATSPPARTQEGFTGLKLKSPDSPVFSETPDYSRLASPVYSHTDHMSPASTSDSDVFSLSTSHAERWPANQLATSLQCFDKSQDLSPQQQPVPGTQHQGGYPAPLGQNTMHNPHQQPVPTSINRAVDGNTPAFRSPPSPIVSPRARIRPTMPSLDACQALADATSPQTKTSPIKVGQSGLWNAALLNPKPLGRAPHTSVPGAWGPQEPTLLEKRAQASGTNWSQTQAALQAVMQQAAYIPPSENVALASNRSALATMKRKHGALATSIAVALQTASSTPSQHERTEQRTSARVTDVGKLALPQGVLKILCRLLIALWTHRRMCLRKVHRRWSRDKQQSRWFQMTELRKQSKKLRKADKYDRSILVVQRFGRAAPFMARRQFKRCLTRLRRRRSLRTIFLEAQGLQSELATAIDAQFSTAHQAGTVIHASSSLQKQTQEQHTERLQAWRQHLTLGLLSERLPHNWEVQYENSHETRVPKAAILAQGEGVVLGVSYVNIKTAATRQAHPNMRQVKKIFKEESQRSEKVLHSALTHLSDFGLAVAVAQAVLCRDVEISMGEYWQLLQGNQHTAAFTAIRPDEVGNATQLASPRESGSAPKQRQLSHSPLTQPAKPSFTLAELDEDHLYGQSQIAPHRTRGLQPSRRSKPSKPAQVVVENRTVLSNMIADTKSRLSALLAKAMQ